MSALLSTSCVEFLSLYGSTLEGALLFPVRSGLACEVRHVDRVDVRRRAGGHLPEHPPFLKHFTEAALGWSKQQLLGAASTTQVLFRRNQEERISFHREHIRCAHSWHTSAQQAGAMTNNAPTPANHSAAAHAAINAGAAGSAAGAAHPAHVAHTTNPAANASDPTNATARRRTGHKRRNILLGGAAVLGTAALGSSS